MPWSIRRWKASFQTLLALGMLSTSSPASGSEIVSSDVTSLVLSPNPWEPSPAGVDSVLELVWGLGNPMFTALGVSKKRASRRRGCMSAGFRIDHMWASNMPRSLGSVQTRGWVSAVLRIGVGGAPNEGARGNEPTVGRSRGSWAEPVSFDGARLRELSIRRRPVGLMGRGGNGETAS